MKVLGGYLHRSHIVHLSKLPWVSTFIYLLCKLQKLHYIATIWENLQQPLRDQYWERLRREDLWNGEFEGQKADGRRKKLIDYGEYRQHHIS